VALERPGELADGSGEGQIEEQLEPARAPLVPVVAVGSPQCRVAQMHGMTTRVAFWEAGLCWPGAEAAR
jgi:hypothetical protein